MMSLKTVSLVVTTVKLFDPLFLYTVSCVTGVSCCACARDELSMVANNSILKRFVFAFECFAGNKDFDLHIENNFIIR